MPHASPLLKIIRIIIKNDNSNFCAFLWTKIGEIDRYEETKLWIRIFVGILFGYSIVNSLTLDWLIIKMLI